MAARLAEAVEAAGGQSAVARALGLERTTVYWWIKKGAVPEEQLQRLAPVVRRSPAWLRYGEESVPPEAAAREARAYEAGRRAGLEEAARALDDFTAQLHARARVGGEPATIEGTPSYPHPGLVADVRRRVAETLEARGPHVIPDLTHERPPASAPAAPPRRRPKRDGGSKAG